MKKICVRIGAILMLFAMIASDGALLIAIYYLSAALHEGGHIVAARKLGIGIKEVKIDFTGVRICTDNEISSYTNELILAAAGPFVNLVSVTLAICFFSVLGIAPARVADAVLVFFDGEANLVGAIGFFAASSVLQGGINLLPINTLDGGRMLFCATALLFGERAACVVIKITSFAAAFVLWTVSLYLLLKVSSGLGILVFSVCIFLSTSNYRKEK